MELLRLLDGYEQALLKDIQELIKIPSMLDEQTSGPGAPFGRDVARALEAYLDLAKQMGFKVKNVDGYAGHVEYGEGEEILGVLVHLDVVPPGSGWDCDPFAGQVNGGKLVGRGAVDNKGPAVIALYALKALKESGQTLNKRVRLIAGTDEESGMRCLEYYFKHEEKPAMGFSPDADFPLIFAEKGILHLRAFWQVKGPILALSGGERPNIVPQTAEARVKLAADLTDLAGRVGVADKVEVTKQGEEFIISAKGKSSHASMPEKGENAITRLLDALGNLDLGEQKQAVGFLARVGRGLNGEGLNIALSDDVSGKLTCNLGMVRFADGRGEVVLDVRSPVTLKLEDTITRAKEALEQQGFSVKVTDCDPPHVVPQDSKLVKSLLKVYREVTGDDREAVSIGGGTYARKLDGAVAFGPVLQGREEVAHIANEYIYLKDIKKCLEIYAKAILELVKN